MSFEERKKEVNHSFDSMIHEAIRKCNSATGDKELLNKTYMSEDTIQVGIRLHNYMPSLFTPNFWFANFADSSFHFGDEVKVFCRSHFMAKYAAGNTASFLERFFKKDLVFLANGQEVYRTYHKRRNAPTPDKRYAPAI